MRFREHGLEAVQLELRLALGHAGREPADGDEAAPAPILLRERIQLQGNPCARRGETGHLDALRQHPDDGERHVAQHATIASARGDDGSPDDPGIATELALPELVAQHERRPGAVGQDILFGQQPAAQRSHADGAQEPGRRHGRADHRPSIAAPKLQSTLPRHAHRRQRPHVRHPVHDVRRRSVAVRALALMRLAQGHESIRVWEMQRPEEDVVDCREDRGACADPEREDERERGREAR